MWNLEIKVYIDQDSVMVEQKDWLSPEYIILRTTMRPIAAIPLAEHRRAQAVIRKDNDHYASGNIYLACARDLTFKKTPN